MRCIVMAGGRGERLRPLTDTCPKPLLPVAGRPVLDRLLEKLSEAGIQDVTLAVGYLGSMIEAYVGDGARWGVRADYVRQVEPMGTAGALTLLPWGWVADGVLVCNGDKIIERAADVAGLVGELSDQRDGVVGTMRYVHQVPYGVMESWSHSGSIVEKPSIDCQVVTGFYVLGPRFAVRTPMDMPTLLKGAHLKSFEFQGYVLDIGTPAAYEAACARLS